MKGECIIYVVDIVYIKTYLRMFDLILDAISDTSVRF